MSIEQVHVALFANAREVIKAEKLCRENGIQTTVVPVPPTLSTECGMALRLEQEQEDTFIRLMDSNKIKTQLYDLNRL